MERNSNLDENMYHLENHIYNLEEQVEQNRRMMRNFSDSVEEISEKFASMMRVVFALQSRVESLESEKTGEFVTKLVAPTATPVSPAAASTTLKSKYAVGLEIPPRTRTHPH